MSTHYHVLQGLAGCYMPNDNAVFRTVREARSCAAEYARTARDDGYTVSGSARSGYYAVGDAECIEVTECTEADCLTEEEG
jgi:hypothetical protein